MSSPDLRLPLIVIVGPTAVGKTRVAIQLAERMDGEIISADSRQFYRGMDIGTAKPNLEERRRVPHHLIDVADPDETWSLAQFQQAASLVITDIHRRGKLPFLVGGTGQYIRAVTQGWKPPPLAPDGRLRLVLEQISKERGIFWLHASLARLDSSAAEQIDARNVRRSIRALEVIFGTGRRFSEQRNQAETLYHLLTIGLTRPRPELYHLIDERIEAMFTMGFLEEVRSLIEHGYTPTLPTMSAIGYRECAQVIAGRLTIEEAIVAIKRATRIFVRRQANWFKSNDPAIRWFTSGGETAIEVEEYLRASLN